jgi:MFS family permease
LRALYFTRFASSFGFVTLLTLLPTFIDILDPQGFVLGMFATGLTLAQAAGVVPIAWAGDRYDKRTVLLGGLGLAVIVYAGFPHVASSWGFIAVRGFQGVAATATGLITLALGGDLARESERANTIGTSNAWRFAAAIGGSLSAGALYDAFGFGVRLYINANSSTFSVGEEYTVRIVNAQTGATLVDITAKLG